MKKIVSTFLVFAGILLNVFQGSAETIKPYPIPSYNILVSSPTLFQETASANTKEKRDVHIQVNCQGKSDTTCCASVILYTLDLETYLGPFRVCCGETIVVPIDEREWGVAVNSECQVNVSVWITGDKKSEKF